MICLLVFGVTKNLICLENILNKPYLKAGWSQSRWSGTMRISARICFTARFAQDAKNAKGVFGGFVQILQKRFRIWTEPSPDGRLLNQKKTTKS